MIGVNIYIKHELMESLKGLSADVSDIRKGSLTSNLIPFSGPWTELMNLAPKLMIF